MVVVEEVHFNIVNIIQAIKTIFFKTNLIVCSVNEMMSPAGKDDENGGIATTISYWASTLLKAGYTGLSKTMHNVNVERQHRLERFQQAQIQVRQGIMKLKSDDNLDSEETDDIESNYANALDYDSDIGTPDDVYNQPRSKDLIIRDIQAHLQQLGYNLATDKIPKQALLVDSIEFTHEEFLQQWKMRMFTAADPFAEFMSLWREEQWEGFVAHNLYQEMDGFEIVVWWEKMVNLAMTYLVSEFSKISINLDLDWVSSTTTTIPKEKDGAGNDNTNELHSIDLTQGSSQEEEKEVAKVIFGKIMKRSELYRSSHIKPEDMFFDMIQLNMEPYTPTTDDSIFCFLKDNHPYYLFMMGNGIEPYWSVSTRYGSFHLYAREVIESTVLKDFVDLLTRNNYNIDAKTVLNGHYQVTSNQLLSMHPDDAKHNTQPHLLPY